MTRKEILAQADKCVNGQREQDYGTPEQNFQTTADMWSAYKGVAISPVDVAMMMSLLKIARIKSGGGTGTALLIWPDMQPAAENWQNWKRQE